jgi:hypothetical protein
MATHAERSGAAVVEAPTTGSRGSGSPRRPEGADPAYTIEEFLEDQQLLLADAATVSVARTLEEPDGRVVVMPVRSLLHAVERKRRALSSFSSKYGPASSVPRLRRFGGVLYFLHNYRAELTRSELARDGEPMVVREELLRYLFTCDTEPGGHRIPANALTGFLYDWSHRWI